VTTTDARPTTNATLSLPRRGQDVLTSEWTKLRSVRSTMWSLFIAAVTALGRSVILAFSAAGGTKQPFDPLASIYLAWLEYPVLAIGILGVLTFTAEFASGQIRTTFVTVPRRRVVLAAKATVLGALALVFGEAISFTAFFVSEAILSPHHRGLSIGQPHVLGAVFAAGIALCAIAVLGVALGAILRHTAAAVVTLPALLYLPLIVSSLPAPWNTSIGRLTMLMASYQTVALHPQTDLFSPSISMLVVLAWPAAALIVAAALITRDA
jgi:ABC-2 type transport system permease protein